MHINMYLYIFIYTYECIQIYSHINMYLYIFIYTYECIQICVHTHITCTLCGVSNSAFLRSVYVFVLLGFYCVYLSICRPIYLSLNLCKK